MCLCRACRVGVVRIVFIDWCRAYRVGLMFLPLSPTSVWFRL